MLRKLILALTATAAIGAIALAPTAASAGGGGGWHLHHHWHGNHWYGIGVYPAYVGSDDCYYVKKIYFTPSGKHVRRVLVCD
jgi:hypothetical protein